MIFFFFFRIYNEYIFTKVYVQYHSKPRGKYCSDFFHNRSILELCINGIMQYVCLCLASFANQNILKFIHDVATVNRLVLFLFFIASGSCTWWISGTFWRDFVQLTCPACSIWCATPVHSVKIYGEESLSSYYLCGQTIGILNHDTIPGDLLKGY